MSQNKDKPSTGAKIRSALSKAAPGPTKTGEKKDKQSGNSKVNFDDTSSRDVTDSARVPRPDEAANLSEQRVGLQALQGLIQMQKKTENEIELLKDLEQVAFNKGLSISLNKGEGDCNAMFHALSDQLCLVKGNYIQHGELRHDLIQVLRDNPKLIDGTVLTMYNGYLSWSEFLAAMEREDTWGDHVILFAAAKRFEIPIRVISSLDREINVLPDPLTAPGTATDPPLILGHVCGLHYVSLVSKQSVQHPQPTSGEDRPRSAPSNPVIKKEGSKLQHSKSESQLPLCQPKKKILKPDDLLAEAVPGTLELLEDLGRCLDKEYRYGSTKCWKHLAELFNVKPLTYKDFASSQVHSPTEQLFDHLRTYHAKLTVKDLKDALSAIARQDVILEVLVEHEKTGHLSNNEETLLCSLFDTGPDIIGEMARRLDRRESGQNNWKHLADKLHVPRNVFSQFELCPGENPAEELLDSLCSSKPHLTIKDLKDRLDELGLHTAKAVLVANSRKETDLLKTLMEDLDVLDEFCSVLNKKEPLHTRTGWELLGRNFKVKHLDDFAPKQEPPTSPTERLITHLSGSQPWLTLADFICGVNEIGRHDVLVYVLEPYLPDGWLRQHYPHLEKAE